jgi:hypothetical protein
MKKTKVRYVTKTEALNVLSNLLSTAVWPDISEKCAGDKHKEAKMTLARWALCDMALNVLKGKKVRR